MHQLGIKTYAEFLRLPATDLDRWRYFFAKEPAGYFAENWRWGVAVSSLINTVARLKASDALKPSDIFNLEHQDTVLHQPANPDSVRDWINALRK